LHLLKGNILHRFKKLEFNIWRSFHPSFYKNHETKTSNVNVDALHPTGPSLFASKFN
jgi:hypothetical protein